VAQLVPELRARFDPDLVIANAENASNGTGLTPKLYERLCETGVAGITLGDHVYKKNQIQKTLERADNIVRPANLAAAAVGKRWMRVQAPGRSDVPPLYVFTVLGRIFMTTMQADDPFAAAAAVLAELPEKDPLVLVEVHAEATSEKKAMGYYLDGRVAAVVGTHTHVATADAAILPNGTGYITDVGMCGPHHSVLGREVAPVLKHMTTGMPAPYDVASGDPRVSGVCLEIDPVRRRTTAIERFDLKADPDKPPFVAA
jgi:hypothetical protein